MFSEKEFFFVGLSYRRKSPYGCYRLKCYELFKTLIANDKIVHDGEIFLIVLFLDDYI